MAIDFSPLTPNRIITNNVTRLNKQLGEVNIQIATNQKYDSFAGFAAEGTLENFLSLDSSLEQLSSFERSNQTATAITRTAISTVDTIIEEASDFIVNLSRRLNGTSGETVPIDLLASATLERIESQLNTEYSGKYIFSGSKTNTPPIQDAANSSSYYFGDSRGLVVRSGPDQEITYTVTANEPGFRDLIDATKLAIVGQQQGDESLIAEALELADKATEEIISINARLQISEERIDSVQQNTDSAKLIIQENFDDIAAVDIIGKTAEAAELSVVIQAAYIAVNRANNLSLADYLR